MSNMCVTSVNSGRMNLSDATADQRRKVLRESVNVMVGVTFFGQMFKIARDSALKGKYGHGGRGEEMFGSMLDMELAQRMGRGMKNNLSDAIYDRYVKYVKDQEEQKS